MRWFWVQSEGKCYDENGLVCEGYSGFGIGKNNPGYEEVPDVGPIPAGGAGLYTIGEAEDHPQLGPVARPLTPADGTDTHGRSGFFCHGDSIENPGNASHGCVILPRVVREEMSAGDTLTVVHGTSDLAAAMEVSDERSA
jgi:hypothetical protein